MGNIPTKTSWIRRLSVLFNLFLFILLVLTYLNAFLSPKIFWVIGFLSLAFPYLYLLNFLAFIYWLVRWKSWVFLSGIALLVGIPFVLRTFSFGFSVGDGKASYQMIKVMSYNVRIFDLYEWDKKGDNERNIMKLIQKENPDIICFQEYYNTSSDIQPSYHTMLELTKVLGYPYHYFQITTKLRKTDEWGIAIFSKFPIVDSGQIDLGKTHNSASFADVLIHNKRYRVFNMHLQSIKLAEREYAFLDNVKMENERDFSASKNILRKIKRAFLRRSGQADKVAAAIAASPYAVIVCGDMNDTPASYTYTAIGNNLTDVFLQSGFGFGKSYTGLVPTLRIDYMFVSPKIKSCSTYLVKQPFSDHYPLISILDLN